MSDVRETTDAGRARSSTARTSSLMRRATTLVERGQYDEAIDSIKQAIAICPQDPKFSLRLADIYRAQNRMGPAIEAMKQAVALDPLNSAVNEQLLRILLELGRYDEAITTSNRLIKKSPRNTFARDILGIAYLHQGMIDKALRVTNELIRIDPTDPTHHFKKAVLFQQKGEIADAMRSFARVIEMDPDGEMVDDAREAIAALDSYQIRSLLTIAVEDAVFKTKLSLDPELALHERGYVLSPTGIATLRQIDIDELPNDPQARHYH